MVIVVRVLFKVVLSCVVLWLLVWVNFGFLLSSSSYFFVAALRIWLVLRLLFFWILLLNRVMRLIFVLFVLLSMMVVLLLSCVVRFLVVILSAAGSTSSRRVTSIFVSLILWVWDIKVLVLVMVNFFFRDFVSFCVVCKFFCKFDMWFVIFFGGTRNALASCFITASRCCKSLIMFVFVIVLMCWMLFVMLVLFNILKFLILVVLDMCVLL